ncbi:aspartyl protease family protein [Verrucomicrobiota bacterium sgz303538]
MLKATLLVLVAFVLGVSNVPAAQTNAELPIELINGFIFVSARVGQSTKPLTFLLDSGASSSVLSLRAAKKLGVRLQAPEPVQGVGTETVAYHIRPARVTAGNIRLTEIPLALDLSNADTICGRPVDGLIGMDFFADKVVQIDYSEQRLRLLDRAEESSAVQRLPMQVRNGVICVPLSVNGSAKRWVRLDTGNNDALHWVMPGARSSLRDAGESVGFMTDPRGLVSASVQLGQHKLDSVKVAPHGSAIFPGEAGLLGNGILSRFTVTIDMPRQQLFLHGADSEKQ